MKTTAVIATRGRPEAVAHTVRECIRQGVYPIVVYDGGKNDQSIGRLYKAIELPHSIGAIRARNVGFKAVQTPFVLSLDDDSWPIDGAVVEAEWAMGSDPTIGAIAFDVISVDDQPPARTDIEDVGGYVGAGVMFRRRALEDVGAWAEWEAGPFELEHTIRLLSGGWRVVTAPNCVVRHSVSAKARPTEVRNFGVPLRLFEVYARYYPTGEAVRRMAAVLYRLCYLTVERNDRRYLGPAHEALRALPSWLKSRQVAPESVRRRVRVPTQLVGLAL